MSGDLDVAAGVADFRLIDPPRVSPQAGVAEPRRCCCRWRCSPRSAPASSSRSRRSQLRPVFHKAERTARPKIDLPLLGVVSMIISDADRRRERADLVRFVVASGGLVGVFLVGLVATTIVPTSWLES